MALVDQDWTYRLVGALVAAWLCSAALMCLLPRQNTGLLEDIRRIAGVFSLVQNSGEGAVPSLTEDLCAKKASEMVVLLRDKRFSLTHQQKLSELMDDSSTKMTPPGERPAAVEDVKRPTGPMRNPLRGVHDKYQHYVSDHGNFLALRREIFALWLASLLVLLIFQALITGSLNKNAKDQEWSYTLAIDPQAYLIIGIFTQVSVRLLSVMHILTLLQSVIDVLEHALRSLAPYYSLRKGYQLADVLYRDYTSGIPIWEIWVACKNGDYLLCNVMLLSWAVTIFTIFLGSLQLSASAYGSTSFESDLAAATASTLLRAFVLAVHLVLRYRLAWQQKPLTRPPSTFADIVPYAMFSPTLREDLAPKPGEDLVDFETRQEASRAHRRYHVAVIGDKKNGIFKIERH